ncbi:hypothetical protein BU15DRAFT_67323 [Melanogaster broomeanus]|nr:hypothetical protein BU15DRAFT_67323 [Melanogaster broomeanus]
MAQLPKCLAAGGGLNVAHRWITNIRWLTRIQTAAPAPHPGPKNVEASTTNHPPALHGPSQHAMGTMQPRASGPMHADAHEQACNHNNKDNIAYAHHPTTQPAWALAPRPKPEWSHSLDGCKSDTANDAATSHRRRKLLTQ